MLRPSPNRVVNVDLGCGRHKAAGAFGLDIVALPGVDVVARLDAPHLPFCDGVAHIAFARNVLEHLDDLAAAMEDIGRVLAPQGRLVIEVPYFASPSAHADPTHRRAFTAFTFDHFAAPPESGWEANRHTWFQTPRFHVAARRLRFGRAHRLLGLASLANRWPRAYENLFVYWFPARALEVELVKTG